MSDAFCRLIYMLAAPPILLSSNAMELHQDRVPPAGALILAPNHTSPYDVPCLMRSTPRLLDFLSVVEMRRNHLIGPLYRAMNCLFIDRQRRDIAAARELHRRLQKQRVVVIFPEGNIRSAANSVVHGGPFSGGVVKLAQQTGVLLQPCVLVNTERYSQPLNWLPVQRWTYGINFGEPFHVAFGASEFQAALQQLRTAYVQLQSELLAAIKADT